MGKQRAAPVPAQELMLWFVDGANTDELLAMIREPGPWVVSYSADDNKYVVARTDDATLYEVAA